MPMEVPRWVPPVAPPSPKPPAPNVEDAGWLDFEVEGQGEHVLLKPPTSWEAVCIFWIWIGNLGDGEARVGFRWDKSAETWWNSVVPYLGNLSIAAPKPRTGPAGQALLLRVVGANVRLSVSILGLVRPV